MLDNIYNPDTKNGRKRIYDRAYRYHSNLPNKRYSTSNFGKVILLTFLSIILAIIYSYVRLNFR